VRIVSLKGNPDNVGREACKVSRHNCIVIATAIILQLSWSPSASQAQCLVPDANGVLNLPPAPPCEYLSPAGFHLALTNNPMATIHVGVAHQGFVCCGRGDDVVAGTQCSPQNPCCQPSPTCEGGTCNGVACVQSPGSGDDEYFDSTLKLTMTGTGLLNTYMHVINSYPVHCHIHTDPRNSGDPVQSFDTAMVDCHNQFNYSDTDFSTLNISASGTGHTDVLRTGGSGSPYCVDSQFDLTYDIVFTGTALGPLAGYSGNSEGQVHMVLEGSGGGPQCRAQVPALSQWGVGVFALLLAIGGTISVIRRTRRTRVAGAEAAS